VHRLDHPHGKPALLGPPGALVLPLGAIARNARSLRRPNAARPPRSPLLAAYGPLLLQAAAHVAHGLVPMVPDSSRKLFQSVYRTDSRCSPFASPSLSFRFDRETVRNHEVLETIG